MYSLHARHSGACQNPVKQMTPFRRPFCTGPRYPPWGVCWMRGACPWGTSPAWQRFFTCTPIRNSYL